MIERMKLVLSLILFGLSLGINAQVEFKVMNLDDAKALAKNQDKYIFIDFRADWCKPCIEMEKTTFQDQEVSDMLNNNYIAVKADVSYFDAMDMQELYNVSVLPTILVLNPIGEVQLRLIGYKTASILLEDLAFLNRSNRNDVDVKPTETNAGSEEKPCFIKRWFTKSNQYYSLLSFSYQIQV